MTTEDTKARYLCTAPVKIDNRRYKGLLPMHYSGEEIRTGPKSEVQFQMDQNSVDEKFDVKPEPKF